MINYAANFLGLDLPVRKLDGSLDAGERESFNPVAKKLEIFHLRLVQHLLDGAGIVVFGKELAVLFVVVLEEILVMPECVVCVESDGSYGPAHETVKRLRQLAIGPIAKRMSLNLARMLCWRPENQMGPGPE